mmetsp:Transcript_4431/g.8235  ORF Transcript_4431/g.8235 Transcript_4431/m.8235 type:complete len:105 (-) Transcript_4431:175-489(-)
MYSPHHCFPMMCSEAVSPENSAEHSGPCGGRAGAGAGADADAIGSAADALATEWLVVMVKVFLIGMAVSFSFAQFIHEFVEKPTATAIQKYVLPARQQSAKKVN